MERVGTDGVITIEESRVGWKQELDVVEGMQFDRGYLSQYMVTDNEKWLLNENPFILITDKKISHIKDILPLLESILKPIVHC